MASRDKSVDLTTGKILKEEQKKKCDQAYQLGVKTRPKVVNAIRGFSMRGGKALLDISEIILEYAHPSTLADLWLLFTGFGKADDTYKYSGQIASAATRSCTHLHAKRLQIERERRLFYSPKQTT